MSLTYSQANDNIMAVVKAAYDSLVGTYNIYWESVAGGRASDDSAFFQVFLRHRTGQNAGFPSSVGTSRYRRDGDVTIQCFHPVGKGLSAAYDDAKVFVDAFEGKSAPGGIWFRNVRVNEIGRDGQFNQLNIIVEFIYDEIK